MGLYERKSAVLDGFEQRFFQWVCSTITSQNIYGRDPTIILLTMRPSRVFVKIRCHAVLSTRERSAVRKGGTTRRKPGLESGTIKRENRGIRCTASAAEIQAAIDTTVMQ
ncbi:hypothetical protein TNCV_3964751 [Trichonephila clavipes]|nr:hypothetical protein TNCV_3964751 [Trichonephila clavipes]